MEGGGRLWDSWIYSSPAPPQELRLFWKLLEPGAPPWCPDAGAKGGCAVAPPPRVALADACPAVTRVGPSDYSHHLSCVWFGPAHQSCVLRKGHIGAFALSILCLNISLVGEHPTGVSRVTLPQYVRQQSYTISLEIPSGGAVSNHCPLTKTCHLGGSPPPPKKSNRNTVLCTFKCAYSPGVLSSNSKYRG